MIKKTLRNKVFPAHSRMLTRGRQRHCPDSTLLVSGGGQTEHPDNALRIWDVETGEEIMRLEGHEASVWSVMFSPDGSRIASGAWDNTVRIWDTSTGEELMKLEGHAYYVHCIAFDPSGRRLASGSWDGTVRIWDVATGDHLLTLRGHDGTIMCLAFSPDGTQLVTGADDEKLLLWDSRPWRERLAAAESIRNAQAAAEGEVTKLLTAGLSSKQVVARLRANESIGSAVQHAATNFVLQLTGLARARVDEFFATYVLSETVIAELRKDQELSPPVRERSIQLARERGDDPERLNKQSWRIVMWPNHPPESYLPALRGAEAACKADLDNKNYLNTLGVAQYRTGAFEAALQTLQKVDDLNGGINPEDAAFIAMAHKQLGQDEQAAAALSRLRDITENQSERDRQEQRGWRFLEEAEQLIHGEETADPVPEE